MHRISWRLAAALALVAAAACRPDFELKNFTTNEALYSASFAAFQHHHWDDASTGFEKLTSDLPVRDSLLPRSYWYLAQSHAHMDEYLLAAQSYSRLVESFPEDSLAPPAALESARSYRKLWRKPGLDPTYGETALASYNTFMGLFPTSPLVPQAQREIGDLEDWFAQKDYDAGMYYFRRKFWDSGMIYFKDAVDKYPNTPTAKLSLERLAESDKAIRYNDDAADACAQLHLKYKPDAEIQRICAGVAAPAASDTTRPAAKPPAR
jgi:outer membrane protein assembly factor BamD